jgi:hypothetical protein
MERQAIAIDESIIGRKDRNDISKVTKDGFNRKDAMRLMTAILISTLSAVTAAKAEQTYYATIVVTEFDAHLQPILDKDGHQRQSYYCLLWRPSWVVDVKNEYILSSDNKFYRAIAYHVDPQSHILTVDQLAAPKVVVIADSTGTKLAPLGGTEAFTPNFQIQMSPEPQSDSPCTQADWQTALNNLQVLAINPPPAVGVGGGGGYNPFSGPTYQGHHATSGSPQVICPSGATHGAAGYCYR